MFGEGFYGTRADFLLDLVITSLVFLVPLLFFSRKMAQNRRYSFHRNIQVTLTLILGAVLTLFEWNLRAQGGIFKMTQESRFHGHFVLDAVVYTHLFFAFSTAALWLGLIFAAYFQFASPLGRKMSPDESNRNHRFWGTIAMADALMTGVSAVGLYLVGFVF